MIGVFDSGLGGLSVLSALVDALPNADFTYYADTAHVPYGSKEDGFIQRRVLRIGDELVFGGCQLLVVACNTATAAAVQALRSAHPGIPVVGVEPGIKPAAQASHSKRITVLVTESTARSDRLARLIREHASQVQVLIEPCPGWATHVEMLQLNDPAVAEDAHRRLQPLLDGGVDQVVLGCTHYSFLRPIPEPLVAGKATLIDVADAVARQTQRLAGHVSNGTGRLQLQASASPDKLRAALPALGLHRLSARLVSA